MYTQFININNILINCIFYFIPTLYIIPLYSKDVQKKEKTDVTFFVHKFE